MDSKTTIADLKKLVTKFRDDRDWKKFHNPKDLSMSVSIEANELLELFQWKDEKQIAEALREPAKFQDVKDEIADIVVYCIDMCDVLGIDLSQAVEGKIKKNEAKYPIDKAKGNSIKYTEL